METPKPLFPVAGKPLVWHHLRACAKLPNLNEAGNIFTLLMKGHSNRIL